MDNNNIDQLIKHSAEFERAGDLEKALESYSRALDILVDRAKDHAQLAGPGVIPAVAGTGMISGQYLEKFNEYLRKDKAAAEISYGMGLLFAKMGNEASARAFFEQAIDLTPEGVVYDAPHIGLGALKS